MSDGGMLINNCSAGAVPAAAACSARGRASMQGLSRSSSCSGSIFFQEPMEQLSSFCASAEARSAGAARTDARRKDGA